MKVGELLKRQTGKLVTCRERDTVQTAAALMADKKIGALPVQDDAGTLAGILSERDISRGLAERGAGLASLTVGDLMTRDVVTCKPEDSVKDAMTAMSNRHIRHLLVLSKGVLAGVISQRDVMNAMLRETQLEVNVLRDYARAKG